MSNVIEILSEYVANQIAAGEVVRNGASVVKELMENAIDAGCSWIIVRIQKGGMDYIQVADDGKGMSYDDALTAFSRHATSKIKNIDDIFAINTFGFRGEALPSIASVAEVELKTCREEDEIGTKIEINGGEVVNHCYEAAQKGTQIIVKNLFYNIPARRKHLKSPDREARLILDEFMKIALSYPNIAFFFYNNDNCLCNLRATNLRQRVVNVMASYSIKSIDKVSLSAATRQRNLANKCNAALVDLYAETSIVKVHGYIGKPEAAKKNTEQFFFVNGRYFKSPAFRKAIQNAYDKLLPDNNVLPPFFIFLAIDPAKIDVNIHPAKVEVKFEEEQEIWQIINAAVRESLGKHGIVPMIDFEMGDNIDIPIFRQSEELKAPEVDINPEFNPFDETFSFTNAVKGHDETFRDSLTMTETDAASDTNLLGNFPSEKATMKTHEFFSDSWETDFNTAGKELEEEEKFLKKEESDNIDFSFQDFDSEAIGESSETDKNVPEETYIEIESSADKDDNDDEETYAERSLFSQSLQIEGGFALDERHFATKINGQLIIVDLSRAMNRIAFERIEQQVTAGKPLASQKLLFPTSITLGAADQLLIEETLEDFRFMGFDILLEEDTVTINGIPADADGNRAESLFEELLTALKMDEWYSYQRSKREKLIASLAGTYSTKPIPVAVAQQEECVRQLLACKNNRYTPEGKKIYVMLSLDEMKKMFG